MNYCLLHARHTSHFRPEIYFSSHLCVTSECEAILNRDVDLCWIKTNIERYISVIGEHLGSFNIDLKT